MHLSGVEDGTDSVTCSDKLSQSLNFGFVKSVKLRFLKIHLRACDSKQYNFLGILSVILSEIGSVT